MYLLDTNVVSELRRQSPQALQWIETVDPRSVYLSVISLGEIARGIVLKQTKDPVTSGHLAQWLETLRSEFSERTIIVDDLVAIEWGRITAGRSRGSADCTIAATAVVHKMTLVTRDVADFYDLPVTIINPWKSQEAGHLQGRPRAAGDTLGRRTSAFSDGGRAPPARDQRRRRLAPLGAVSQRAAMGHRPRGL